MIFVNNLRAGIMSFTFVFQGLVQYLLHSNSFNMLNECMHKYMNIDDYINGTLLSSQQTELSG